MLHYISNITSFLVGKLVGKLFSRLASFFLVSFPGYTVILILLILLSMYLQGDARYLVCNKLLKSEQLQAKLSL